MRRESDWDELDLARLNLRATYPITVRADIQQCYPSIYTHPISWALHGKDVAKRKQRDSSLLGNGLDKVLRGVQDGQTNGLLIGPDTSYLAGEIVLAAIDRSMLERGHVGLRYIDDFEFGCDTSSNAEQVLSDLVDSAGEFGLVLNPDKTRVVTEKIPHEEPWVGSLRRFKARREKVNNPYDRIAVRNDYMAYFSAAIDFARKNPHDSVARYAVARVAKFPTDHILWPNLRAFLLEMALEDAGAFIESWQRCSGSNGVDSGQIVLYSRLC